MTTLINKDKPIRERILFALLVLFFIFIVQVLATILPLVALFQFFSTLITGRANDKLLTFSESLAEYFKQITRFISYIEEQKPWPFSPWPDANITDIEESVVSEQEADLDSDTEEDETKKDNE